jgi:hypothetical protein
MSFWQPVPPQRLDARSWRVISRVGAAMLAMALCLLVTCAVRIQDMPRTTALLSLACTSGAVLAMAGACWRRDRHDPTRLSGWDEALAFNFLALLAHTLGHAHLA